ncbi:MAG: alpha/beta fold hydrolase, partial [Nocardioidaceae bacterium]
MSDELGAATSTVTSGGMRLAVRTAGDAAGPTVVLVHGFPDTQSVWDPVATRLVRDGVRVVTYDVRGAGASEAPPSRAGYRVEHLVDDLVAVLAHAVPDGGSVHLVGHDWGSVQLWAAVAREEHDERLRGRIASYTTISGPALEHFGHYLRAALRRRDWRGLTGQLRRSWYVAAFQVPLLPEWVFRTLGDRIRTGLVRSQRLGPTPHWTGSFAADAARGVNLYRANASGGTGPRRPARTRVPVQLIVPRYDAFLSPAVYEDLPRFAPDLTRVDVDAGHWVPQTHPDLVAGHV